MKITIDIPEVQYNRYKQYYEPYIIKECPHLTCDQIVALKCKDCGKVIE